MSKLSFRARALDTTKPMPVLRAEDVPDLPDFAAINRAVPQMPTGMEKEEECEHHLQRAISAQQAFGRSVDHVIPTPEVFPVDSKHYDMIYPPSLKLPRQYIHLQLPSIEKDQPEYDMDSEDEGWFNQMQSLLNVSETRFEEMIECLEKNSSGQKVIGLSDAKLLLTEDESVIISVYDYWLNKKLNVGKSLIPIVKTERRDGTSGNNPYIAFRRRTEKMQTRKNRKNDESSYAKMIKLRRDFIKVRDLMEMIRRRELMKNDFLKCNFEIYDKRYELCDFDGQLKKDIETSLLKSKSAKEKVTREKQPKISKNDENNRKRYKKRPKHESPHKNLYDSGYYFSSDEENANDIIFQNSQIIEPEESNPDGLFAFKRKKGCNYFAPVENSLGWPWDPSEENDFSDKRFQFKLASLSQPPNYLIGYSRRRIGRGGRINPNFNVSDDERDSSNIDDFQDMDEWTNCKPSSSYLQNRYKNTVDFNSSHLNNEDLSQDQIILNLNQNRVFKYNESQLLQFVEMQNTRKNGLCNAQQSNDDNSARSHMNSLKSKSIPHKFDNSIDADVCSSILNSVEVKSSENFVSDDELKLDADFDFEESINDVNSLNMLIDSFDDNIDLMFNSCEKQKFDNLSTSENNMINN